MKYTYQELTNPTKEDLEFFYDGAAYSVLAGGKDVFPDFIAKHGAKKLADKNWSEPLNKAGYLALAKSYLGEVQNEATVPKKPTMQEEIESEKKELKKEEEFEDLDDKKEEEKKVWCEECGSLGFRHKKGCPKSNK